MITAKQLIDINNQKRTELTPENEKYYSDFLIYIRLQFFLSEQQTEEILMELLDHLIEGQNDGKSAEAIFGDNPKEFADDLIQQIPNENKKIIVKFISGLALNLLGNLLIIRGVIIFIVSFFRDVETNEYPFKFTIMFLMIMVFSLFMVWVVFKIINDSLFQENQSNVKDALKAGTAGMVGMGAIIVAGYFLPKFGPAVEFTWYTSLIVGIVIWGISKLIKKIS